MSEKKSFEGSVCLVWFVDGRQKYRFVTGNEALKADIKRLEDSGVPRRAMVAMAINWEDDSVMVYIGEKREDMPS